MFFEGDESAYTTKTQKYQSKWTLQIASSLILGKDF